MLKHIAILSMAILLVGCSLSWLDPNPPARDVVEAFIETQLHTYWQARYAAYRAGEELPVRFLQAFEQQPSPALPAAVTAAYAFYFAAVEAADWGNVYLIQSSVQGHLFYLIHVTTDGDDGWIELYSLDGSFLGAARRYLELVEWSDQAILRQQTNTGELPAALHARLGETLWGK